MDTRTMMRELDEVIARAQSAAGREAALLDILSDCDLHRRKQMKLRAMRAHVHRLQRLRSEVNMSRRRGFRLS